MSLRGRGALEIKSSTNPFFQTSSQEYGAEPHKNIHWKHSINPSLLQTAIKEKDDFSFLYRKSSDAIGAKFEKTSLFLPQQPTKTEFLRNRREILQQTVSPEDVVKILGLGKAPAPVDPIVLLNQYKHEPKNEDPKYTLSSNDIGKQRPTLATFVTERATRQQEFSRSFNHMKPKNSSLNTSLTRSTVHPKLDPQFV